MANLFDVNVLESPRLPVHIKRLRDRYRDFLTIEKGNSPLTIELKVNAFRTFILRTGITHVSQITPDTVKFFFYKQAKEREWSANTYRNYWGYLRCFCDWAIKNNYLKEQANPVEKLDKPKKPKVVPRRLSKEQVRELFATCCTYPWKYLIQRARNIAVFGTFISTGIRHDELLNIRINDVSFKDRTILIRKGKGGKVRIVKIPFNLTRLLQDYESHIKRLNITREYFFCTIGENTKLRKKDIYRLRDALTKATGIKFVPHELRHTFASMCLEEKIPITSISKVMGHESISYTECYLAPEYGIILSHFDEFSPLDF